MRSFCLRRLHITHVIAAICCLLFMVYLYNAVRVLDMYTSIKEPGDYDLDQLPGVHVSLTLQEDRDQALPVAKKQLLSIASYQLSVESHVAQGYILINDYKLKMEYFPTWFWNINVANLTGYLGSKRHAASAKVPFFVQPGLRYRSSSWAKFQKNVKQNSLYISHDPALAELLQDIESQPIVVIKENPKDKHFSFTVQFKGGAWAVMRPKRLLEKESDRHFANIAAFQLDRTLGFHRVPPSIGRFVNIQTEIMPLVSDAFRQTMYKLKDGKICFYGTCAGCSKEETSICGSPDNVEVSLTYLLPNNTKKDVSELVKITNPWQKIKIDGPKSDWVSEEFLCTRTKIQYEMGQTLLLEILDAMYFDNLIDNSEREHYIIFGHFITSSIPLLFEQGNAFGDSCEDETLDGFLFRRGGCCRMKKSTFLTFLKLFLGPTHLATQLANNAHHEATAQVLHGDHMVALDRRVNKTIHFVIECLKKHDFDEVIINDIF